MSSHSIRDAEDSAVVRKRATHDEAEIAASIGGAVHEVCPDATALKALHEPVFEGNEAAYVEDCVRTGWVSSVGGYVDRFEADLALSLQVERAVAVVNGTAALEIALRLVGCQRGDEVVIPSLTFVGTANAVVHAGGVPHFADSESVSLGMDPAALRTHLQSVADRDANGVRNRQTGRRIAAVVPVHIFGHPVDMASLTAVCSDFELPLVEDAAEGLGSTYHGRPVGSFGRVAALSFNGNKIVTTGGGGALITNDVELAQRAKHVTTTAKVPHSWRFDHDMVAWNYRLPNINAALGCAQFERLSEFVELKRHLAARYARAFQDNPHVRFVSEPPDTRSNYWLNAIMLNRGTAVLDDVLSQMHTAGIAARPAWTLMHHLPMYSGAPRAELNVAEDIASRLINLPSGVRVARAAA